MSARRLLHSTARAAALALVACAPLLAGALPAPAALPARSAAAAPEVEAMVVGRGDRVLAGTRWVSAAATAVALGSRSCAVAAGTPLAALAALARGDGPSFALRDYGRCGSSPANSSELFVTAVGGEPNRGSSGWEYKVEGVSGSTGAADPSGPRGDGRRIGAGQRVLWFYCEARAAGCQRTLAIYPARATVVPGGRLTVSVRAYDNEGRAIPAAGARVTLGSHTTLTGAAGTATLALPSRAGGYWLGAARVGTVPAFPGWVSVR